MRALLLVIPVALLAACDRPDTELWACAGRPDLLVTADGPELTILNVNDESSATLTEADPGIRWVSRDRQWQIVGLDQALYTVNGSTIVCRRPG